MLMAGMKALNEIGYGLETRNPWRLGPVPKGHAVMIAGDCTAVSLAYMRRCDYSEKSTGIGHSHKVIGACVTWHGLLSADMGLLYPTGAQEPRLVDALGCGNA